MRLQVSLLLISTMVVLASSQTTRYVASNGHDTFNNCSNPTAACKTIGYAVNQANAGDTIKIYNGTYQLSAPIIVNKSLSFVTFSNLSDVVIIAPSSGSMFTINTANVSFESIELNGNQSGSTCLMITSSSAVTLSGLVIHDCSSSDGGAINVDASSIVAAVNCTFINNTAAYYGGGIYNSGTMNTNGCTFINNTASYYGGGIHNYNNGTMNTSNCTFVNNTASSIYGGGISNWGTMNMSGCTFINNTASYGGGIYNYGIMTTSNCTFINNTASQGGGISNNHGRMNTSNCTFINNTGGIYNYGTMNTSNCTFVNNTASYYGGGISNNGAMNTSGCTFINNTAFNGGGISNSGTMSTSGCTFINNTVSAIYGGGIYNYYYGTMNTSGCTFTNNTASIGGGISNYGGTMNTSGCTFTNNTAYHYGGGIYNSEKGVMNTSGCTFINNTAFYGGGVFNGYSGTLTIAETTLSFNNAINGSAIYIDANSNSTLTNCSISHNWASGYGGGAYFAVDTTWYNTTFNCNQALLSGADWYLQSCSLNFACMNCTSTPCRSLSTWADQPIIEEKLFTEIEVILLVGEV